MKFIIASLIVLLLVISLFDLIEESKRKDRKKLKWKGQ